jgi:primosomal protein N' (replication factor Y)
VSEKSNSAIQQFSNLTISSSPHGPHGPHEHTERNEPSLFLLLGSATPSIETYFRASFLHECSSPHEPHGLNKPYEPSFRLLSLPFRATAEALPKVTVVDLRQEFQKKNLSMVSDTLGSAITDRLEKKEQVILFLNKRGAASAVICRDCGFTPRCKKCDLALTYHVKLKGFPHDGLLCHSCGFLEKNLLKCPVCGSLAIRYVGSGTEKAHLQLQQMFPTAKIVRADKDTASGRHAFEKIYQKMWNREADILLGTQMITKGLDLPKVTLVGILIADIGLHIPDFRASERVFQLLMQVSGRSGRHQPGEVIIQTYQPDHPAITKAANHDYHGFYNSEISIREQFFYPPFLSLIRLTYTHRDAGKAEEEAKRVFSLLSLKPNTYNLQPDLSPHYIPRLHGKFIWNILIRGKNGRELLDKSFFAEASKDNILLREGWKIDVDPQS